jgi:hypothetical protein
MCPACIVAAALIAGKATSTGGLTAVIVTKFRPKNVANKVCTQTKSKETDPCSRGDGRAISDGQFRRSDPLERLPDMEERDKHSYGGNGRIDQLVKYR